jgi:exodeoxyribonuclease VII large subunit
MKQSELVFGPPAPQDRGPRVLTVTEAVKAAARALEARFGDLWVEGEISNCKRHSSGHIYFSLKDRVSQLPAVMFRIEASRLKFAPTDGLKVRCRGRLTVYEQQGKFQLYVTFMEPAGLGAQQLALEQLKRKLEAEGLFAQARKRPLPRTPLIIGVVTSRTGAAVRDIIRVLHRRAAVRVVISPTLVQGPEASGRIVRALRLVQQVAGLDVVIIGRGGGSAEDLWAFNDEQVVRAVAGCRVPVISAVGHEVDTTLCDWAADVRAPTPSAAAELAVAVHEELREALAVAHARLARGLARVLDRERRELERLSARLDLRRVTSDRRQALDELLARLRLLHPRERLARDRAGLERLEAGLAARTREALAARRRGLLVAMGKLDALSPLRVLERGYSITTRPDGRAVRAAEEVGVGDELEVRLSRGRLRTMVISSATEES